MRIFTALLGTETNTFSPFLTGWTNFEQTYLVRGGEHGERPAAYAVPLVRWRALAQAQGWDVVESVAAFAMPAGVTLRPVYESLRAELVADLKAAMPVDMVLLIMHGAMVADGYDDCEGDVAAHVRAVVGENIPVGVELDLHCHLTEQLISNADAVVTYKEYPHIDTGERAEELFDIVAAAARGQVKPVTSMYDCKMIGVYHTTRDPVKRFVARMQELEDQDGVLSVSLGHGFPWGDVPDLGTRVLVVTDDDRETGNALARQVGQEFYALRDQVQPTYHAADSALDHAVAAERFPVVLADVADNAGGGAPNDSTFLLQRVLERQVPDVAIGCIWDPVVVEIAMEIGTDVETTLRIGGKMGPMSGEPVDLAVRIGRIALGATQKFGAGTARLGNAVALHAKNGLDIVVISHRTQTFSPEVFTNVGIDPQQKKILVVKSMQHFYAGFEPIMAEVLYVTTPGSLVPVMSEIPYQRAPSDLWPFPGHTGLL